MSTQSQSQQQPPHVQAQLEAGQDVLAVVCVIDASLHLATEWTRVVTGYIFPLLKRLTETYSGHQFWLALVTYGEADMRPTPLLSRRFFSQGLPNPVMKELREDPKKLGIGFATGVRGLSALEGMVTAIEFFDILNKSLAPGGQKDKDRMPVSHILHVAACPPDSAQRPAWNTLQHLDAVSWNTLPLELQKRNINMSLVTLQQIPQFQEIQAAASTSGSRSSPWFTVHAPHIVMLSGFPPLSHLQTPKLSEPSRTTSHPYPRSPIPDPSKRPNEASQSPDTKRQKLVEKASPSLSPRAPGGAGAVGQRTPQLHAPPVAHPAQPSQQPSQLPSQQPPQQSSQPLQSSPVPPHATAAPVPTPGKSPVVPAANPLTNAPNSNATSAQQVSMNINTLVARLKGMEIEIKTIDTKIQDAQSSVNTAAVESLQKERNQKLRVMTHLRNIAVQQMRASQATGSNTGAGGSGETPQPPPPAQVQAQPAVSNNIPEDVVPPTVPAPIPVPTEEQKPLVSNPQALMQFMQARGGAGGFPSGNPELAAQMQKLINKTGIQPQPFSGSPAPPPAPVPITQPQSQPQSQPQPQASTSSGGLKQWEGSFVLNAASQQAPGFEVQLAVVQCTGDLHAETWPDRIIINVAKEGVLDRSEIQAWIRGHHHSVAVIHFKPHARNVEQSLNEKCHLLLLKVLTERRTFAVAQWKLPSGNMSNNMIVFPMGPVLVGAAFPLTGLPDLPGAGKVDPAKQQQRQQPQPQPQPQPPPQFGPFSPEMVARLRGLDPQRRGLVVQQLMQQQHIRQQQQRQQQQQQQTGAPQQEAPAPAPAPGVGMHNMSPFMNAANLPMNMFGVQGPNGGGGGVPQRQAGGGVHPGGGPGTVNYEMMQSFIQRSDGSSRQ